MKCDSINSFKQEIPVDNDQWNYCLMTLQANLDLGLEKPKTEVVNPVVSKSVSKESEGCEV